ncbi:hypothetical protein PQX77_013747, partial [Marasmius sp. AFHP31]
HDLFWKVEQALERIVGVTPAMARPPFGNYNDLVRQVAAARGQTLVNWDYDTQDAAAVMPSPDERVENYRKLIEQHPSTILALNHEVKQETVQIVMPKVVNMLKDAGYRMVTVAECLGMQPYQKIENPQTPDVRPSPSFLATLAEGFHDRRAGSVSLSASTLGYRFRVNAWSDFSNTYTPYYY